jgi:hypothetical protein
MAAGMEQSAPGEVLERANGLLRAVGIRAQPITDIDQLRLSASSMFVAVYEAIFKVRPESRDDYRGDRYRA